MFVEIAGHQFFALSFGSGPKTFLAQGDSFIELCTPEPNVEQIRRGGHHILLRVAMAELAERLPGSRLVEIAEAGTFQS